MTELHETYLERVGTGVAVAYSLAFDYISSDHVKLFVDSVEKSFTFPTTNQLLPDEAPPDGSKVIVRRVTPSNAPMVDFNIAGAITPANIDLGHQQALNVAQEAKDVVVLVLDSAEAIAASELEAAQSVLDAGAFVQDAEDAVDAAEVVRDAALDARDAAAASASEAEGYKDTVLAFVDPEGFSEDIINNSNSIAAHSVAIAENISDIQSNAASIVALPAPTLVVNSLTSTDTTKALSANQGKQLKTQLDAVAAAGGSVIELIAVQTISATVASVEFTGIPTSGYIGFKLIIEDAVANNGNTNMDVEVHTRNASNTGWNESSNSYRRASNTIQDYIAIFRIAGGGSTFAHSHTEIDIRGLGVYNRATTALVTFNIGAKGSSSVEDIQDTALITVMRMAAEQDTGLRIKPVTNSLVSGKFTLLGIKAA